MSDTVDNSTVLTAAFTYIDIPNGASSGLNGRTFVKNVPITRTRTGNSNPNWRQQVAAGSNATTNLSGTWQRIYGVRSGNFRTLIDDTTGNPYFGPYDIKIAGNIAANAGAYCPWYDWDSRAEARASNRFLSKVRSAQVRVSGPTFLGEMREALQMIKKPAAGLQDLAKRYLSDVGKKKRQRGRKPNAWMGDIGNLWLENAFGWQPLLNDITSGIDAYNSLFDKSRTVYISAAGRDMKKFPDIRHAFDVDVSSWYQIPVIGSGRFNEDIVRYRGALWSQAATTSRDRFARFGFTPSEFVPTAWELLPWSFLIDYFASVGDVLSGAVTDTSSVRWVNRSQIRRTRNSVLARPVQADPSYWWMLTYKDYSSPSTAIFESKTVARSAGVGIPSPKMVYQLPSTDGKLANIAALLAQASSSIHPQSPSRRNYRL